MQRFHAAKAGLTVAQCISNAEEGAARLREALPLQVLHTWSQSMYQPEGLALREGEDSTTLREGR